MGRAVSGHRLRLRSLPGHGRAGPCPQVGLGLAVRVRVAPAGCAPAAAEASSIRLPLRAVSGSPVTRLPSRSAQGWRQRAGGRSGASLGGGGRAGRVRRAWLRCGVAGCGVGGCVAGALLVRVLRACACSDWVRLGGASECVARRSDCSIVVCLLGVRRSHRPDVLGAVGASLLTTCALDLLPLAPGRRADHISPSFPLFPHIGAGRVHSWYVVYP